MPISKKMSKYIENASWIRKLFEEGNRMRLDGKGPVYDFSIGNPELEPPEIFKKTLKEIVDEDIAGKHRYMENTGYENTRKAVAKSLTDDHGIQFDANKIIMTVGAGGAINVALKALIDPQDEVIIIKPYFVEYKFYIDNHSGVPVLVQSTKDFDLDIEAIDRAITEKTRVILINNPNNPTGVVYEQNTLNELGKILAKHSSRRDRPIFLIDDAPYRKLVYDMDICPSIFNAYDASILATSHSKDLGIPGERIGFLAISPKCNGWKRICDAAAFANRTLGFVNAPGIMQRVVEKLQKETIDMEWYRRRRDRLVSELKRMGYEIPFPRGGFYLFPKAPQGDDIAFISKMKDMRVLVVPGVGFGQPGYFRISYCVREEVIEGALPAFEKAIKN